MEAGNKPIQPPPQAYPHSTRAPFKPEGKAGPLFETWLLKATERPDKDLVTENLWPGLNRDTVVDF